ncbi:MAG TPA: cobalamin B12-binding domain-containing protein [Myxococcaceae bacterium]|nr:cobalamin B12-binding domain-containing protein [Myxococcaceae bacterium]
MTPGVSQGEDLSDRRNTSREESRSASRNPSEVLSVIESEIIPRLRLAHRGEALSAPVCAESRHPPTEEEIAEFARIAACHDLPGALAFIESMCRQGLSLEVLLLELVAGAARLLGEHWKQDLRTFNEVSAGLGTLQQLVHILGPSFAPALPDRGLVVLIPAPGEQHTLGLFVVGEFMRRAGWGVHIDPAMSQSELYTLLETRTVLMLGISLSTSALAGSVATLVDTARKASRNPRLSVVLGGSADLDSLAANTGAHLAASDPRKAVALLEGRPGVDAPS